MVSDVVSNVLFSSNDQGLETPQWLFDLLDAEYKFTLDVCATKKTAKCWNYYTPADNGLRRRWEGSVWCNPPYGRDIGLWTARAVHQIHYKRLQRAVFLLPVRTDTRWWHDTVMHGAKVLRFIDGRLRFVGTKGSAPFPSVIVVYSHGLYPLHIGPSISARGRH